MTYSCFDELREIVPLYRPHLVYCFQSKSNRMLRGRLACKDSRQGITPELEPHGCNSRLRDRRRHKVELELVLATSMATEASQPCADSR